MIKCELVLENVKQNYYRLINQTHTAFTDNCTTTSLSARLNKAEIDEQLLNNSKNSFIVDQNSNNNKVHFSTDNVG